LASAINPPKFSQTDSTLGEAGLFPVRTTRTGDDGSPPARYI